MRLSLVTWNVLADCYIRGLPSSVEFCGDWNYRKNLLADCLQETTSDLYCLQEVDHFDDFYSELLHSLGYESIYLQRPNKNDGCLIAFKNDRFVLKDQQLLNLDQLSHLDRQVSSTGRSKFAKQNVAIFALLADRETEQSFIAATCHLHWNPNLPEVKFAQAYHILDQLSIFRQHYNNAPVILTGDFNSLPDDEVYRYITGSSPVRASCFNSIERALLKQKESTSYTYGAQTRFLCDASLNRLGRWMRVLGIDVAQDNWETSSTTFLSAVNVDSSNSTSSKNSKSSEYLKRQSIALFFNRARSERRVILTTSKTLLQRASCPPSYFVKPDKLDVAIVDIFREFGLELNRDKFLTVCGKCGGEIEEVEPTAPHMMGRTLPTDRQIFACTSCHQPYWWNEQENSSPAKAMKKADALYDLISKGLIGQSDSLGSTAEAILEDAEGERGSRKGESLSAMFANRDRIISSSAKTSIESHRENSTLIDSFTSVSLSNHKDDREEQKEIRTEEGVVIEGGIVELDSVFRSLEQEPLLTNWNGEFKGTLDYIFITKDWHVEEAKVLPKMIEEGESKGKGVAAEVSASQPSEYWPSDHFMIKTELKLDS